MSLSSHFAASHKAKGKGGGRCSPTPTTTPTYSLYLQQYSTFEDSEADPAAWAWFVDNNKRQAVSAREKKDSRYFFAIIGSITKRILLIRACNNESEKIFFSLSKKFDMPLNTDDVYHVSDPTPVEPKGSHFWFGKLVSTILIKLDWTDVIINIGEH